MAISPDADIYEQQAYIKNRLQKIIEEIDDQRIITACTHIKLLAVDIDGHRLGKSLRDILSVLI